MLVAEGTRARHVRVLVVDGNEVLGNGLRWLLTRVPWVERCSLRDEPVPGFDLALVDAGLGLPMCERIAATGARTEVSRRCRAVLNTCAVRRGGRAGA